MTLKIIATTKKTQIYRADDSKQTCGSVWPEGRWLSWAACMTVGRQPATDTDLDMAPQIMI